MKHNKNNDHKSQGNNSPSGIQDLTEFATQLNSMQGLAQSWTTYQPGTLDLLQNGLKAMDAYGKTADYQKQTPKIRGLIEFGCIRLWQDLNAKDWATNFSKNQANLMKDFKNFTSQMPQSQQRKAA